MSLDLNPVTRTTGTLASPHPLSSPCLLLRRLAREGISLHYGKEKLEEYLEIARRLAGKTKK